MSVNRLLLCTLSGALVLTARFSLATAAGNALPAPAAQSRESNTAAAQDVVKMNEDCNAAMLRADVATLDRCVTDDFTHTHSSGRVEHKAEYLRDIGNGAHKFLTLDWSDVHVRTYGDSAIVEGKLHLRADNRGSKMIADNQLGMITVWVKQQGKWREAAWFAALLNNNNSTPAAVTQNK